MPEFPDLKITVGDDHVAVVEIDRPPHNYFSLELIRSLADALTALDGDPNARAVLLCSNGKSFCAGADFSEPQDMSGSTYREAVRLFSNQKPIVAAIQGAAVGGGFGLSLLADLRVAAPEARFWANFSRLGFHHGFGLTVTLPAIVGQQVALDMLLTARRISGEEALAVGLCDRLAPLDGLREEAHSLALEIARGGPLAIPSIRATMRGDLAQRVKEATDHELEIQAQLIETADFAEGVKAMNERRLPDFRGV